MKNEIYEDSDIEDYPKEICPNLIHRYGWCIFWGMCIAWSIIILSVFGLDKLLSI